MEREKIDNINVFHSMLVIHTLKKKTKRGKKDRKWGDWLRMCTIRNKVVREGLKKVTLEPRLR